MIRNPSPYALVVLLMGATAIGLAPILVRLSDVGPIATAFYRLLLSLPVLWIAVAWTNHSAAEPAALSPRRRWAIVLAGLFFAADLAAWHWSIVLTSVANATLLANLAPIFVALGAAWLFQQRPTWRLVGGMVLALAGAALLAAQPLNFARAQGTGDALGVLTALFYAGYLLVIAKLRTRHATAVVMLGSSAVGAAVLLPLAWVSGDNLLPAGAYGWGVLITLAVVSHALGQGLITWALAHLPVAVGAVGLLWQPVAAAALAWVLFAEPMGAGQLAGAALVLAGIAVARLSARLKTSKSRTIA